MKVAGFGFKRDVTVASLREALIAAGGAKGLAAVATVSDKAEADALTLLARELGLPIKAVAANVLAGIETPTKSGRINEAFGRSPPYRQQRRSSRQRPDAMRRFSRFARR